jgi:molybdopterin-guanine dinucleotide biosynthesis protein
MVKSVKNKDGTRRLNRALSVSDVYMLERATYRLSERWHETFGEIDRTGVWLIWGKSGSGKTSFVLELCKELARFGRVAYDSLEEGDSLTMKNAFIRAGMMDVARRVVLLNRESMADLHERLSRPKSPDIVVIDSFQYTRMRYAEYQRFKEAHADKLIIFVSHATGDKPKGQAADAVMYDATQKILVKGYVAISKGRFKPGGRYVIWDEGARRVWGEDMESELDKFAEG